MENKNLNMPNITVGEVVEMLSLLYSNSIKNNLSFKGIPTPFLWGPAGIGKSEAIVQLAEQLEEATGKNTAITDVRLLLFSPVDLRGVPVADEHKKFSNWLMPKIFDMNKVNISQTTYEGYKLMIESRMIPFFREYGDLKVKDITGDEINDYYISIRNAGLKGTTAQRHHALLHLAFKTAVKRRAIPSNPVEQADRPKGQQYIGKYYNASELKELLDKTEDDPIHIVIFLAAYYGLRRSEALGLKWSAIDFENKTVSINHKVVQNDKGVTGMDVMKTKSSYRTLPLIPQVEEALLAEREKQEEMKRVMRRGYCKRYTDYVCVDAIGELIKPNYVTDHFKVVLKEHGLKPVRFHDLRHSCASLLLANGVPMKMIQDWLGHSDMGTTANIYSHIDSESKKASAMAIGSALG